MPAHNSQHDGAGLLRDAPYARAAARRAVQLWLNGQVRESCGDSLGPGGSFMGTFVTAQPAELPALIASGLLRACLEEATASGAGAGPFCMQVIRAAINAPEAWAQLREELLVEPADDALVQGPQPTALAVVFAMSVLEAISFLEQADRGGGGILFDFSSAATIEGFTADASTVIRLTLSRDGDGAGGGGGGLEFNETVLTLLHDQEAWKAACTTSPPSCAPSYSSDGTFASVVSQRSPNNYVRARYWWLNKHKDAVLAEINGSEDPGSAFATVVQAKLERFERSSFSDSGEIPDRDEVLRACLDADEYAEWSGLFKRPRT